MIRNSIINKYGTKYWYDENNNLHRVNEPAIEWYDGNKEWWIHGSRHRENGPAIYWINNYKRWFLNNKEYTESEFYLQISKFLYLEMLIRKRKFL